MQKEKTLETKIYNVALSDEISKETCAISSYSLHGLVDEFIQKNYKELHIIIDEEYLKKQREKKYQKEQKNIFYNSKRSYFYCQYKTQKLDEGSYKEIIASLKLIKKNSKTVNDFKEQYQNFIEILKKY